MNKTVDIVKTIGRVVVLIGVGAVAKNIVTMTTPEDTKKITKACIYVGSVIVSGLATTAACDKYEATFDTIVETVGKWLSKEKPPAEEKLEEAEA